MFYMWKIFQVAGGFGIWFFNVRFNLADRGLQNGRKKSGPHGEI